MAKFSYIAHNIQGEEKRGTIQAPDHATALSQLRGKGLFPTEVIGTTLVIPPKGRPEKKKVGLDMEIALPAFLSVVRPKQLMVVTRQLSTLIHAGLPLLRGLNVLKRQEKNPALKRAIAEISASIESGSTFADALAQHPRIFNKLYINMVKAGEAGGLLDVVLERLAAYMEKAQKVRNKIASAMTYPIVVLLVSSAIMGFLMVAIIPRFEQIFADMLDGRALPPLTLFVMGVSARIQTSWPIILAAIAGVVAVVALLRRFRFGRMALDWFKLAVPLFGNLARMGILARFARTLGTLLESGVPILQALAIVKETLDNEVISQAIQDIHDNIKEGESMAAPVEANRIFPPIFGGMVEVGEETGELPAMLIKVADLYEDEVDNTVAALSSIIEPLLIVLLAVVVGTIVIALFLPMVSIIGNLS
ncbi:MAG: type II secretion system F family protein [Kiritimatiellales bacterium]|nr:type II secretion system F family protein [Kiritimatiellales bacterium]MCF7863779.1 type II secretion system F family protein [Kiritimatiellales bacterium]